MSSFTPKISIGMPVYNSAQFLEETLDSVLAQTYPDFELIISDNASTDQTEAICHAYAAKDRRIRYYRNEKNLGAAYNYRRTLDLSTGEYFKWAASDDVCEPDYLSRCVDILDGDQTIVLAYSKVRFIDEKRNMLHINDPGWDLRSEAAHERLRYVIYAAHWVNVIFGLIRANALVKTRLVASYRGGDYRLLGELSLMGKFFEIPEYLFLRRLHPGASSQNATNMEWQMEFYTGGSRHICLPIWNRSVDHFLTIMLSNLAIGHKLSLVGSLLHCMRSQWRRLLKEVEVSLKTFCRGWL